MLSRLGALRGRHLGPVVVVTVVVGVASAVGAQVDPVFPAPRSVWAATCVPSGSSDMAVFGRGWGAGPVTLSVTDNQGATVGGTTVTSAGATFQGRVLVAAGAGTTSLRLAATQGGSTAEHLVATVGSSCTPTITAVASSSCAPAGSPVRVTASVRGAPTSAFDLLLHHADLFGPAEVVERNQPARPAGDHTLPLTVANVPDRSVPVGVEARRRDGTFAIATTYVTLPPGCPPGTTPTTAAPGTVAPGTTLPAPATTAPAPSAMAPTPPRPTPFVPSTGGPVALSLSPSVGRAGDATTVSGRGFAPSSTVILRWRPGIGQWTVTAGGDGSFRTQVLVLPNDVEGPRVLEVLGGGGSTPAPFLVVPGSGQPAFGGVFVRS